MARYGAKVTNYEGVEFTPQMLTLHSAIFFVLFPTPLFFNFRDPSHGADVKHDGSPLSWRFFAGVINEKKRVSDTYRTTQTKTDVPSDSKKLMLRNLLRVWQLLYYLVKNTKKNKFVYFLVSTSFFFAPVSREETELYGYAKQKTHWYKRKSRVVR
eukprot:GEMP01081197.1.p1 GENE.GEMP01081197.1~~GEMP01081197.1.p1  ORF type:complete len:156 (-),score=1.82 GEMP01081197.1:387-854(-)